MDLNNDANCDILSLLQSKPYLKICAPMVRYSKLQFRQLVRIYDCDLTFTPMILADSFILSDKARTNEFTTSKDDIPLIVQFATNNVNDFVAAAYLVSPFSDGVDLNCGCPQRWAKKLGLGCALIDKPELINEMIKECKAVIDKPYFTISVKTRILHDMRRTVDLCQKLDKAGVSFLTIHGRTPDQSTGDVDKAAIRLICENVSCPVIANGGVETLADCDKLSQETTCNGVMVANGLLSNPSLFTGHPFTFERVQHVVEAWIKLCFVNCLKSVARTIDNCVDIRHLTKPDNVTFQCFHHHLVFMLSKVLKRQQKQIFNNFKVFEDVLYFISENNLVANAPFITIDDECIQDKLKGLSLIYNDDNKYVKMKHLQQQEKQVKSDSSNGKYFNEFTLDNFFI